MSSWASRIVGEGEEPPDQLLANPRNWRIHPQPQQQALGAVLDEVGWVQRVIVNRRSGFVVDGHLRVALALSKGEPTVPVVYVDLSPEEEALVLASLDPLAGMAVTDEEMLRRLTSDLRVDDAALAALLGLTERATLADPDDVPELPAEPITQPGDLWRLGEHRLLCGDATTADDADRALDGRRADLCLTDPPYGNGWDYASTEDTPENLDRLVAGFMPCVLSRADVTLVTCGNGNQWRYPVPTWTLCWAIPAGTGRSPWGFSCWQPVLAYGNDPYLAAGLGARPDVLVQTETAPDVAHPAAKPVGVWSWFMERGSTHEGDLVFDPFGGSGTTLIVAEQLHRSAALIEIDPGYCDVIVQRWENFTGEKAKLDG